jgi:hypothetical protein
MGDDGFKIRNTEGVYFLSFATVGWVDVFTRSCSSDVVVNMLKSVVACQWLCFRLRTVPLYQNGFTKITIFLASAILQIVLIIPLLARTCSSCLQLFSFTPYLSQSHIPLLALSFQNELKVLE